MAGMAYPRHAGRRPTRRFSPVSGVRRSPPGPPPAGPSSAARSNASSTGLDDERPLQRARQPRQRAPDLGGAGRRRHAVRHGARRRHGEPEHGQREPAPGQEAERAPPLVVVLLAGVAGRPLPVRDRGMRDDDHHRQQEGDEGEEDGRPPGRVRLHGGEGEDARQRESGRDVHRPQPPDRAATVPHRPVLERRLDLDGAGGGVRGRGPDALQLVPRRTGEPPEQPDHGERDERGHGHLPPGPVAQPGGVQPAQPGGPADVPGRRRRALPADQVHRHRDRGQGEGDGERQRQQPLHRRAEPVAPSVPSRGAPPATPPDGPPFATRRLVRPGGRRYGAM